MGDITPGFFYKIQNGMSFEDLGGMEQQLFLEDWIDCPDLRSTIKTPPSIKALEDYKNGLDKRSKKIAGLIKKLRDKKNPIRYHDFF
ncbi:hypothetical protein ES703_19056 [subsurface metagenome]